MTEENTFRKTTPVPTHDSAAGQSVSASTESTVDFAMLEPRDQLKTLLQAEMKDKPFSELSSVLFDHRGASIVGHILLDTLEEAGYSVDDFRHGRRIDRRGRAAGLRHDPGRRLPW